MFKIATFDFVLWRAFSVVGLTLAMSHVGEVNRKHYLLHVTDSRFQF